MPKSAALQILNKNKKAKAEEVESQTDTEEVTPGEPVEAEAKDEPKAKSKVSVKTKPKAKDAEGGTVTKTKPKTKTVTDEIADTASAIENLTEPAAFKQLQELLHGTAFDEFRMGGILAKIQTEGWLGEHPNFRSLVEAEFGIKYRVAMMWVAMYKNLVESGVPWSKLKRLGWTKVSMLSPILTEENVDDILQTTADMSALQVSAYVQAYNTGEATSKSVPDDVSELKSKTFKLFPGQKESVELAIEKAKKETGTDSDAAALEFIAIDFASGTKKKPAAAKGETQVKVPESKEEFVTVFQAKREAAEDLQTALTDILEAVNDVFPEAQISVELEEQS